MLKIVLLRGIASVALLTATQVQAADVADAAVVDGAAAADSGDGGAIVVTATRTEKQASDVPATVSVIDSQTIDDRFINDVKDLVRYEPGVAVRRAPSRFTAAGASTGRDRDSGFNIRGLEGNRVLITVDGVRVPDGFSFGAQSVGRGDYVDLDLVKSVEILRGPASALYGSDGVAGAVSFVTKDPADFLKEGRSIGGGVRAAYDSSDESWTEGGVAAGQAGQLSFMAAYTRRDGKELDNKGSNDSANSDRTTPNPQDTNSNAMLGRIVWTPNDAHRLRLTYEHFDSDVATNVLSAIAKPPLAATSAIGLTADDTIKRDRATIDYRYVGTGFVNGAHAAAWWQKSRTLQVSLEDRSTAADRTRINRFDNRVYGAMLQIESKVTSGAVDHLFVYGGDVSTTRQTGIRDGTVPPAGESFPTRAFPATDYTLTGFYLQDEMSIADGVVSLFPALRWDHYKLDPKNDPLFTTFVPRGQNGSKLTPRIGLVVKPVETIRLFASYAQGFKAPEPNQINNGFANIVANYRSVPNPDLKPETSRSVEGGVRFVRDNALAEVTVFNSRFRNFIDQVQTGGSFTAADPAIYQYINLGRVRTHGIEAKGNYTLANGIGFRAAASWAKGSVIQTGIAGARPLDSIEPFKLVGGLFFQPEGGPFRGEIAATRSAGKKPSRTNNSCKTATTSCFTPPGFWVVDLTASYRLLDRATVRAGLFNLFDKKYFWWSDVRGLASSSTIRNAYSQPGRKFGASVAVTF